MVERDPWIRNLAGCTLEGKVCSPQFCFDRSGRSVDRSDRWLLTPGSTGLIGEMYRSDRGVRTEPVK